ncbi:hypothetical protein D3C71_1863450 [compost metagenome]
MVVLKSVNGILDIDKRVISRLTFDEFINIEQDCVDESFPLLASKAKIPIDIVNGLEHEQLRTFFREGTNEWGTRID